MQKHTRVKYVAPRLPISHHRGIYKHGTLSARDGINSVLANVVVYRQCVQQGKKTAGTTLAPSSASNFAPPRFACRPPDSVTPSAILTPVFGVSVFLARHKHADNIPEERTVVSG
ncbi:hypothetical protein DBV15_06923 [Temnothorax longispinosus]|uniref:Uncharacterized protein n=1 Tax=Temnothorax longispinosus TaxID=300112 RepID=A0A4S2KLZ1_9HYME|nr:hypothetical protein DBV15_06923 [Temnothorax longispinosus]